MRETKLSKSLGAPLKSGLIALFAVIGQVAVSQSAFSYSPFLPDNNTVDETVVHLFEWTWDDVGTECEQYLSKKGYDAVQVSPPQEHVVIENNPWFERYQNVSYNLISRSGNEDEFRNMVRRCSSVGVKVYVDVVINHMTGLDILGTREADHGFGGTRFGRYSFPGIYTSSDFNHCGRNGHNNPVENYQDRWEVQNCNLLTLMDLKTSSEYVRDRIAQYLNKLLDYGVSGFRVDGAKHIPSDDVAAILAKLNRWAYIYQEVIDFGSEPISSSEYLRNGKVTEFRYGSDLSRVVKHGKMAWLDKFGASWGMLDDYDALVFVDNHDSQRGHGAGGDVLTHRDSARYALANVFMLAWPYGSPRVMSSYPFSTDWEGPPRNRHGDTKRVHHSGGNRCFAEWKCEHRWTAIANMVQFRHVAGREAVNNWWSNGNNQIAFGRGNRGFVVINNEYHSLSRSIQTSMAPGYYCNVTDGNYMSAENTCSGKTLHVNGNGQLTVEMGEISSIAIHQQAKLR